MVDDLERRGLLSNKKIAEIVHHYKEFEYRLKHHSPLKKDFMAYIDYKKHLIGIYSILIGELLKCFHSNLIISKTHQTLVLLGLFDSQDVEIRV